MKRYNVLFLTRLYPEAEAPFRGGYVLEHARSIAIQNEVTVVHCERRSRGGGALWQLRSESAEPFAVANVPLYRVREKDLRVPYLGSFTRLAGLRSVLRVLLTSGFSPDIIHANFYSMGFFACLLGRYYRLPVVITEHTSEFPRRTLSFFQRQAAKLACRQASVVMPVSSSLQRDIESYGIEANFHIVPNALDTDMFFPRAAPAANAETKNLLCIGAFDPLHKKGVPFLLRSFARLAKKRLDWHLDLVGDGPTRREYEDLVNGLELESHVTFHGFKTRAHIARKLRECSFLVSASPQETFGMVLLESLASGTPVVAIDSGGPSDFLTSDKGRVVPPDDPRAFVEALDYMLDHAHEYQPADLASGIPSRFSLEVVGQQFTNIYRSILE